MHELKNLYPSLEIELSNAPVVLDISKKNIHGLVVIRPSHHF